MATKIIKITRGDSFEFVIDAVELQLNRLNPETDIVYFAIMEPNQPFEEALIVKGFTNQDQNNETGEILIKITPNDTSSTINDIMPPITGNRLNISIITIPITPIKYLLRFLLSKRILPNKYPVITVEYTNITI